MNRYNILNKVAESRKLYLKGLYVYIVGFIIGSVNIIACFPTLTLVSLFAIAISLPMNIIALIKYHSALREIEITSNTDSYTQAKMEIIYYILLLSITLALLLPFCTGKQDNHHHNVITSVISLINLAIFIGIWFKFFRKMFVQLEKFTREATVHLFVLSLSSTIINIMANVSSSQDTPVISDTLYGIWVVISYIQIREFLIFIKKYISKNVNKEESLCVST